MVRFPSVLYPFSILLIFSSSERLLLYCTCHRCAANARIYAVSIFWIRIANVADLLYLCLSLFHSRNLTLNDLGRCCGVNTRQQAVYSIWQLLVRFIARLHRVLISTCSDRVFARNLLFLPINDSTNFKILPRREASRKLPAPYDFVWSRNIRELRTGYILFRVFLFES